MKNGAYIAGCTVAIRDRTVTRKAISRMRREWEFWEGFHHARPLTFHHHQTSVLEDPTRPGGWISHKN